MVDDLDVAAYEAPRGRVCDGCRKRSDAAVAYTFNRQDGTTVTLCGTHFDEWLRGEPAGIVGRERLNPEELTAQLDRVVAFAKRLREGKYRACWKAETE